MSKFCQRLFSIIVVYLLGQCVLSPVSQKLHAQDKLADRAKVNAEQISQWIEILGSQVYLERQYAKSRLRKAGAAAYSQLYRAQQTDDLEVRLTIRQLLEEIDIQWVGTDDSQAIVDLMIDYQNRNWQNRLAIVDRLFWMPLEDCWQALYRISVYDQSEAVSRYAASRFLQIMFLRDDKAPVAVQNAYEQLSIQRYLELDGLLQSNARWGEKVIALGFALGKTENSILDPDRLFARAFELQRLEKKKLALPESQNLPDAQPFLIDSLLMLDRVIFELLEKHQPGASPQVVAKRLNEMDAVSELPMRTPPRSDETIFTLRTLIQHERWETAKRLVGQLDTNRDPLNAFWELEIIRLSGDTSQARARAELVVQNISKQPEELAERTQQLLDWRLEYWAAYQLQTLLAKPGIPTRLILLLAELEIELGQTELAEQHARQVWETATVLPEKIQGALILSTIATGKKQPEKEFYWLQQVLKIDPLTAIALVKMKRLEDAFEDFDAESFRQKVAIAKGAYRDRFRLGSQMAQSSKPAEAGLGKTRMGMAANSLAWLLINLDEETEVAQWMAHKAVDLEPLNPSYLDTLAYCEYQRGNRKQAIELQRRAVFIAPGKRSYRERLQEYLQ